MGGGTRRERMLAVLAEGSLTAEALLAHWPAERQKMLATLQVLRREGRVLLSGPRNRTNVSSLRVELALASVSAGLSD